MERYRIILLVAEIGCLFVINVSSSYEGKIRLSGSEYKDRGRLEIYHSGTWGTVCNDEFKDANAEVVCKQLGISAPLRAVFYTFGDGSTGQIWMDNVIFTGTESYLKDCEHLGWGTHNCGHVEDVGIACITEAKGGWGIWSSWNNCSMSCETGYQTRSRECDDPIPFLNGQYCVGDSLEMQDCSVLDIDGNWGDWSMWNPCSVSCNTGYKIRTRQCNSPPPSSNGQYCVGDSFDALNCTLLACNNKENEGNTTNNSSWFVPFLVTCIGLTLFLPAFLVMIAVIIHQHFEGPKKAISKSMTIPTCRPDESMESRTPLREQNRYVKSVGVDASHASPKLCASESATLYANDSYNDGENEEDVVYEPVL